MNVLTSNHVKIEDGRLPVPKTSTLLRAALSAMVVDIANKMENLPPSKHDALVLEWRLVGVDKSSES